MTEHAIELLDHFIYEHTSGNVRTAELEKVAEDTILVHGFNEAHDAFVPGRLDQARGLDKLQELMQTITEFLNNHFSMEETLLLEIVEGINDNELLNAYNNLTNEHEYLKTRVRRVNELAADLKTGKLTRQHWDSAANDLRAYLKHTRKLLMQHAAMETDLFTNRKQETRRTTLMTRQTTLTVNRNPIQLDYYVGEFVYHTALAIVGSLRDTGEVKDLKLEVHSGRVSINLNGDDVSLKEFPMLIITSTLEGMLKHLKGVEGAPTDIVITVNQ